MIFKPLLSSSHGNAYIISDDCTHILLECGASFKKMQNLCGFQLSAIDGCLVSHEHKDHSKCVDKIIKAGVPVYLSQGTAASLELPEAILDMAIEMEAGKQFTIGSMDILPFQTFHDAKEPLGFLIQSRVDGDIFAFATDTVNLPYRFPGVNILAVEANVWFGMAGEASLCEVSHGMAVQGLAGKNKRRNCIDLQMENPWTDSC